MKSSEEPSPSSANCKHLALVFIADIGLAFLYIYLLHLYIRKTVMNPLPYFMPFLCLFFSLSAAASNACLGDSLDKAEIKKLYWAGVECSRELTHIKKIDINDDGVLDYVISKKGLTQTLFVKGERMRGSVVRFSEKQKEFCPIQSANVCIPEVSLVPSILTSGYDVLIRSWRGCATIRYEEAGAKWRTGYLSGSEDFDCSKYDNREYLLAQTECILSQGRWKAGVSGGGCIYPASDDGKPCRSSQECEKICIYEGSALASDADITGVCAQHRSCRREIVDGKLGPSLCYN